MRVRFQTYSIHNKRRYVLEYDYMLFKEYPDSYLIIDEDGEFALLSKDDPDIKNLEVYEEE